jgi:hypothetical protein
MLIIIFALEALMSVSQLCLVVASLLRLVPSSCKKKDVLRRSKSHQNCLAFAKKSSRPRI